MQLPFDAHQFFGIFARYNAAVWPAQIALELAALTAVFLALRPRAGSHRVIAVILGGLWLWMGSVYHLVFFRPINPAAAVFGALFMLEGVLLIVVGWRRGRLRFAWAPTMSGGLGAAFIGYALIIYPILAHALGHRYPATPTFGLPCPTTILTLGLLAWAEPPRPWSVLVIPLAWSVLGVSAAVQLGVWEDLGLVAAGGLTLVLTLVPRRRPAASLRVHGAKGAAEAPASGGTMRRKLGELAGREFDLLVVGGGICGAAVAWDAAQRGLSVALLERGDFGGETSANSLKVVHGGIRYLQHLDLSRVRESCRERSALLRIAPHLVHPLPIVVPTFGHGSRGAEALGAAFVLLNGLTADRNRGIPDAARRIPKARLISRRKLLAAQPELDDPQLTGAGLFWDGQLYNPPRLVWEFVRTAGDAGAVAANYCEVVGFLRRGTRVVGVAVSDRLGGERFEVRARVVVNAAGPFAEQLHRRSAPGPAGRIPLSRDLALVVRRRLVQERVLAVQTKYQDPDAYLSRGRRHLFVVPWRQVTLIGVNSVVYQGDPDGLTVTEAEVQGFLDEINEAEPRFALTLDDVALVHAGLVPIGADELVAANVSFGKRSHVVDNAQADGLDGLVTAVCNRYTTARGVAERAVDLAFHKLGTAPPRSRSAETPLHGGRISSFAELVEEISRNGGGHRPGPEAAEQLAHNHGSAYGDVLRLARETPYQATLGASRTLGAEVVHAIREEMAQKLADCVFRRTDLGTAGHPGDEALAACAALMAAELGWSAARIELELAEVRTRFPGPPGPGRLAV